MVAVFVGGNRVGTLDLSAEVFASRSQSVELWSDEGKRLGTFVPEAEPLCPWDPTVTKADLDETCRKPGKSLGEILKRLGAE